MTTVAITGATGIFGRALAERLDGDGAVDSIVGIARRPFDPAGAGLERMVYRRADVLDADALDAAFAGSEVVCHLAFTVTGRRVDPVVARRVSVDGSHNVFAAAVRAGVRRLVYASSVAAYGAHPDNPVPITEDAPTRGNAGFRYGQHKAEVEAILDAYEAAHPELEVVRLRPCVVVGPRSAEAFRGPFPPLVLRLLLNAPVPKVLPDPGLAVLQLVHEDDVAEAFALAITHPDARGAYNVAGAGTLHPADLARELGAVRVPVPLPVARAALDVAARLGVSPIDAPWLDATRHPIIVDTTRLRRLGWVPTYDTRTALDAVLAAYGRR